MEQSPPPDHNLASELAPVTEAAAPAAGLAEPAIEPSRRNRGIALAIVLVVTAALAWYRIGDKSLWFDESVSWYIAHMSTSHFLHALRYDEPNMPLYYAALRGWIGLNGDGETWMRLLSAACGLGTIAALYALGRRLFSFNVAIAAAAILATNAFFVQYTQEARSYMMAALLATLATYLFVRAVDTGRGWWLYAIVVALGIYAHFYVVLVPLAQVLSLIVRPRAPGLFKQVTLSLVGAAVLTLPYWWVAVARGRDQMYKYNTPTLDLGHIAKMISGFAGGAGPLLAAVVGLAAVGAIIAAVQIARTDGRSDELWRIVLPLLALAIPMIFIFATALVDRPPALRYLSFLTPALAIVVARGIMILRDRRFLIAGVVVVVALQAIGLRRWYNDLRKEDWRAAVAQVERQGRPGDAVVLYNADSIMLFQYYDRTTHAAEGPTLDFPPGSFNPFPLYTNPHLLKRDRLAEVGATHDRVWYLVPNDWATDAPPLEATQIAGVLAPTHVSAERDDYFRVGVTLYERR
jgi:mannosyltransferase